MEVAFVVAVGDEAKRESEAGEKQRPGVEVGNRAPAREADPGHPVMEVLIVGPVDRLAVLQALQHHEGRVEEGDGEQDQRQHQGDNGGRLDRRLDRDHAHQEAQQVRSTIAHEARGGGKVEDQEAERGAGGQRGEHAGSLTLQIEGDDRHRRGDDRADARREAVYSVGEVDHVHHPHQADHRQDRAGVGDPGVGKVEQPDEGHGDDLHPNAEVHDYHRRNDLAGELYRRREVVAIVERPDERDDGRGKENAVPQLVGFSVARRQPDQRGDERAREDRQPAKQGGPPFREPALARLIDRSD